MTDFDMTDFDMTDFDDEAQMVRALNAQTRVDEFNALPPAEQHQRLHALPDPEQHRNALRTLELHGTPQLHDWLLDLENDVIDLLRPEDQEHFRRNP